MRADIRRRAWIGVLVVSTIAGRLHAHPLAPSLLALREAGGGRVDVEWKVPAAHTPGAAAAPVLPPRCRDVTPRASEVDGTGVVTRWAIDCGPATLVGERVGVRAIEPSGAVVRIAFRDGRVTQRLLMAADPWLTIPAAERPWDVMRTYVRLGISHILTGPDHLLFVFGLVLLAGTLRRVLGTVTAFTVGHSLTLAAAVLGLVALPQPPIEIAIALSVFLLAVELARDPDVPSLMRRRPWAMAAAFGLLHGLGFAAALSEAGLDEADVPIALLAFNLGIEVAQVAFVAIVLGARAAVGSPAARLPEWGRRIPVYAMGSLAAFWWIERTVALFQ